MVDGRREPIPALAGIGDFFGFFDLNTTYLTRFLGF
jgi:hypothetical protein